MHDLLKGNFKTKSDVKSSDESDGAMDEKFEKEAMKHLGGSIAFVRKKKILWDENEQS